MKNESSSGCGGMSNEILKCCSPVEEVHLFKAFNDHLRIGSFLECLEIAKIIFQLQYSLVFGLTTRVFVQ